MVEESQSTDDTLVDSIMLTRAAMKNSRCVLVITGAGISAESGVPTFRGAGGYWRNRHFTELAKPEAFAADPKLVWEWYCERRKTVAACEPNAAHHAIAKWAQDRDGVTLVTQNVDGLHERAGHPDVIRLHGSLWRNRCTECGAEREERSLSYDSLPTSPCCWALERPAIVWFDEPIPTDALTRSIEAAQSAIAVLVIGTSGVVMPAAAFVSGAHQNGALVIDVNPDDSSIQAHIKVRTPAAMVLPIILS
ncbi:MAG: NAD-dependent protein deacylase [Patescibacteria group bacterium]